jgi:serine-type D-Ala-D-Ala carboxypeptidase/endopeptidase (penicillin-binding protein 4)
LPFLFCFASCQSSPKRIETIKRLTFSDEDYLRSIKSRSSRQDSNFPVNTLGYLLYDPVTKKIVDSQNENLPFIPASTTKVLTSVAALKILGPQFQFRTFLAYTGRIQGNVLHGDLYLKGEGDPSLTVSHIMSLARTLSDHHIQAITGNFYYDETAVVPLSIIKEIGDSSSAHNPGLGALSVDFNQFFVHWQPSQGSPTNIDVTITPDLPLIEIGLSPDQYNQQSFTYEQNETSDKWSMSSKLSASGEKRLPIRRPSLLTAFIFSRFCNMNGIILPSPKSGILSKNNKILAVHQSAPLVEISERALEYSNNMMTELVLLAAARKIAGKPVSVAEASRLLKQWFVTHLEPSQWDSLQLLNGSGLTSGNRITPSQLVAVLRYADQFRFRDRSFESLLPISGWKGTLSNRLGPPESAFRVWAKTGSMFYSNTLAGYLYTLQGKRLIFAIMLSDLKEREAVDSFRDLLPEDIEVKANTWTKNARQLQDRILQNWILSY